MEKNAYPLSLDEWKAVTVGLDRATVFQNFGPFLHFWPHFLFSRQLSIKCFPILLLTNAFSLPFGQIGVLSERRSASTMQHPLGGLRGVGGEKKKYIPSSLRQKAAYKNGTRRLIFSVRPSKAYEEEKALNGKTDLFPFTTGSRYSTC